MITPIQKTEVLLEAMPWLRSYRGATVVIKYGGNAMVNEELRRAFAADIQFLHQVGLRTVVVHGGGAADYGNAGSSGLGGAFHQRLPGDDPGSHGGCAHGPHRQGST